MTTDKAAKRAGRRIFARRLLAALATRPRRASSIPELVEDILILLGHSDGHWPEPGSYRANVVLRKLVELQKRVSP